MLVLCGSENTNPIAEIVASFSNFDSSSSLVSRLSNMIGATGKLVSSLLVVDLSGEGL